MYSLAAPSVASLLVIAGGVGCCLPPIVGVTGLPALHWRQGRLQFERRGW